MSNDTRFRSECVLNGAMWMWQQRWLVVAHTDRSHLRQLKRRFSILLSTDLQAGLARFHHLYHNSGHFSMSSGLKICRKTDGISTIQCRFSAHNFPTVYAEMWLFLGNFGRVWRFKRHWQPCQPVLPDFAVCWPVPLAIRWRNSFSMLDPLHHRLRLLGRKVFGNKTWKRVSLI